MKRLRTLAVLAVIVLAAIAGGWWFLAHRSSEPSIAEQFPSVAGPCPDNTNDLAGIEGWAPGAGKAAKMGENGNANVGGFGAAMGGSATTPQPESTGCRTLAPQAVAYFANVDKLRQAIPDDGDPTAIGATLKDADAVFAFVRDRIHTEAYPGTMRGQLGALASHGGSSADKALVLGGLLATKSVPARYVHTRLTDADAARVLAAVLAPASPTTDPNVALADKLATEFKIDLTAARTTFNNARAVVQKQTDEQIVAAQTPVAQLAKQLADANRPLSHVDSLRSTLLADVRDHWWVQANINGAWIDLDPTLPDARSGSHVGGAASDPPVTSMPDELDSTVTVRLISQTLDVTGLHDATVLESTAKAQDLYDYPISIGLGVRTNGEFDPSKATEFVPSIQDKTGDPIVPDPSGAPRLATLRLQIVTSVPGAPVTTATRVLVDRRATDGKSLDRSWT
ncbi:MAG: hypothetical protein M3R30_08150, partial [Candidatus Eremiobacteraeota bacterium]|nr:hypothetical protein [Candidatus Eremiobacteraeota bacterium]